MVLGNCKKNKKEKGFEISRLKKHQFRVNAGSGVFMFARHGRTLTGESPEHAQIVGSV